MANATVTYRPNPSRRFRAQRRYTFAGSSDQDLQKLKRALENRVTQAVASGYERPDYRVLLDGAMVFTTENMEPNQRS